MSYMAITMHWQCSNYSIQFGYKRLKYLPSNHLISCICSTLQITQLICQGQIMQLLILGAEETSCTSFHSYSSNYMLQMLFHSHLSFLTIKAWIIKFGACTVSLYMYIPSVGTWICTPYHDFFDTVQQIFYSPTQQVQKSVHINVQVRVTAGKPQLLTSDQTQLTQCMNCLEPK